MRWFVNDLSVQGQFASDEAFVTALASLLRLRRKPFLERTIYCARDVLRNRAAVGNQTVAEVLRACAYRDFKNLALGWLDKFGPFVEDDRQAEENDYFEYSGFDVTDQGLGEAARRSAAQMVGGTFSFPGGVIDFCLHPLIVQHGLAEQPLGHVNVTNTWTADQLLMRATAALPKPATWAEQLEQCKGQFDQLVFGDDIEYVLSAVPFSAGASKSILDLLEVLQRVAENRLRDGSLSAIGLGLQQKYFVGSNAWFSDESAANKARFRAEMTFPDPESPGRRLVCFWHGKVQTPQLRIHFEWPIPVGQTKIKVVYIGPKISKK